MIKSFKVFDFTNVELEQLAIEYVEKKLNRPFTVGEVVTKRKTQLGLVDMDLKAKDLNNRVYDFRFYFSDYHFDCVANNQIKDNSNDSLDAMELLLTHYTRKFSLRYIEIFREYQVNRLEKSYKLANKEATKVQELEVAKRTYFNNLKQINSLCDKVFQSLNAKNV